MPYNRKNINITLSSENYTLPYKFQTLHVHVQYNVLFMFFYGSFVHRMITLLLNEPLPPCWESLNPNSGP